MLLAIAGAVVVWGLFYSSFFKNPAGLLDSFRTYATYFDRAGNNQLHIHPWYYYLNLLLYSKADGGPPWTEAFVVILAVVGLIVVISRRGVSGLDSNLLDFIAGYTVIMTVVYSAIPYKTPWCLLSFYHGMILLAAVGVVAILNLLGRLLARVIVAAFFADVRDGPRFAGVSGKFHFFMPTSAILMFMPTRQTTSLKLRRESSRFRDAYPAGREMPVWVVCPDGDYWPLPWYLRSFKNVGWWNDVNEISSPAPVVIASAGLESRLITRLYDLSPPGQKNLYVPLFDNYIELRPRVELRGYVTKDLWDQWQSGKSDNPAGK